MALINGLYVFVETESRQESVESTTHPTEEGLPITSTIRKEPVVISLQGRIVDTDSSSATDTISQLEQLMETGSLVSYSGRTSASNFQIQSFNHDYDNKTWGGCVFTMELKQVRIAETSYTKKNTTSKQQATQKKTSPSLKVGATVVFKGGSVYVSSDATKAAANRGRSTCKITIISTASYSKHQYHLISSDGGMVYGWVDKANIEGVPTSSTTNSTKAGTKQVSTGTGTKVYHTVKAGDTVWGLVNNNYKSLGKSVDWVISNNPSAFSRPGDPTTLKVGAKLLMGTR